MFVEKFFIVDRKWASTFCDNWILQKKAIERNVHLTKTIREYKNVVKKNLKIVEHVNAITLQNQSQSQSQSQKSTFSISSESDKSEKRQCVCEIMHDWKNYEHIVKSVKSSNWKCNQQERKWIKNAFWNHDHFFMHFKELLTSTFWMTSKQNSASRKKKTTMTRNLTMKKQQMMISQMLNLQIWQIENHQNMLICLSIKRLTILFEEALFTILIVMIHLFMIWIDS
jgi:hypothetical protein